MFATWSGAETCLGAAGKLYKDGLAGGFTDPLGYALALFLVGALFAVPLWKRGLTTLADLFKQRYGAGAERFAALVAGTGVWALTPYIVTDLAAPCLLSLASAFGAFLIFGAFDRKVAPASRLQR